MTSSVRDAIKLVNLIVKGIFNLCSFYRRVLWNSLVFSVQEHTTLKRPINHNQNFAATNFFLNEHVFIGNCDLIDNISSWIVEPIETN